MENEKFQQWVDWANQPSKEYPGRNNILPELVSYVKKRCILSDEFYECWKNPEKDWSLEARRVLSPADCETFSTKTYELYPEAKSLSDCLLHSHTELVDLLVSMSMEEFWAAIFLSPYTKNQMVVVERNDDKVLLRCSDRNSEITIPNDITVLGDKAFAQMDWLQKVIIPDSVIRIGALCFDQCVNLEKVILPKGIREIKHGVFSSCKKLKSIVLPDSIERIDDYVFSGCYSLETITIPKGVRSIGWNNFKGCDNLRKISILSDSLELYLTCLGELNLDLLETTCGVHFMEDNNINSNTPAIKQLRFIDRCDCLDLELFHGYSILGFAGGCPKSIKNVDEYSLMELRVNIERNSISNEQLKMLKEVCYKGKNITEAKIILAAPARCEELSIIPGYIKVTEAYSHKDLLNDYDRISDINIKYILKTEPKVIERYKPINGCIITCASNNGDSGISILVYESKEMVDEKIKTALENLSKSVGGAAGLLNELNRLILKGSSDKLRIQ